MRILNLCTYGLWAAALVAGGTGGCKCQQSVEEDASIDRPPIIHDNPAAARPTVNFPARWQTKDASLNKFISDALQVCADGDYDGFRKLFGSNFKPPAYEDFVRIWKGVHSVEILSVHAGPQDPPEYYVNALVKLRQPDRRDRQERNAWVAVFKEGPEWRMAPPPKDIMRVIKEAVSQPASAPATPEKQP